MMTHHDSWRSMSMERICHLTSIFKAEKRHESPILQLHLSKSWHHGLLFDLLLDYHGNPWKCLRRKGHSLPEGEKSMGASSWASSSCPQRHETSITSRFEDGKKEILTWPQHYINLRWLWLCGARDCFQPQKKIYTGLVKLELQSPELSCGCQHTFKIHNLSISRMSEGPDFPVSETVSEK